MKFRFNQNARVSALEVVPEEFRHFYVEDGDGFAIRPEMAAAAKAYDGLNQALDKSREGERSALKRLESNDYKDLGSPEEVRQKIAELETKLADGEKGKAALDKMRQQLLEQHQKDLSGKDGEIVKLRDALYEEKVTVAATAAIAAHEGNPALLRPLLKDRARVVESEGKYQVEILDDEGVTRLGVDGQPMSVDAFIKGLKADPLYAGAFKGNQLSGSGAPPAGGGPRSPGPQRAPAGERSPMQKLTSGLAGLKG